jgi:hypothetical protein
MDDVRCFEWVSDLMKWRENHFPTQPQVIRFLPEGLYCYIFRKCSWLGLPWEPNWGKQRLAYHTLGAKLGQTKTSVPYSGSQRVLFSTLLNNPLLKLAGFFGFVSSTQLSKLGRKELLVAD